MCVGKNVKYKCTECEEKSNIDKMKGAVFLKRKISRITLICFAIAAVLLAGFCLAPSPNAFSATPFPDNSNGETYGDLFQTREAGVDPDLILAAGENGVVGYVRAADLEGPVIASPEEALAIQDQREEEGYTGRYIDLFESDGETVIGRFFVQAGAEADAGSLSGSQYTYGSAGSLDMTDYTATGYCGIKGTISQVAGITVTQSDEPVQAGWLGGKVRIYDSNGILVQESDYCYTSSMTSYFSTEASYYTSSGYYYSYGLSKVWNPTGSVYGVIGLGKSALAAPNT